MQDEVLQAIAIRELERARDQAPLLLAPGPRAGAAPA
jgi:hypothetical protein